MQSNIRCLCVVMTVFIALIGIGCDREEDEPVHASYTLSTDEVYLTPTNPSKTIIIYASVNGAPAEDDIEFSARVWTIMCGWLTVQPHNGVIHNGRGYVIVSCDPSGCYEQSCRGTINILPEGDTWGFFVPVNWDGE